MKKYCMDLDVARAERLSPSHVLLCLTGSGPLPPTRPGQFVSVRVDASADTYLRRPFSINYADTERNEIWLLIRVVGPGTERLSRLAAGDRLNCLFPLGNGFTLPSPKERVLLVGGGVGAAPLLYLGAEASAAGAGAKSSTRKCLSCMTMNCERRAGTSDSAASANSVTPVATS